MMSDWIAFTSKFWGTAVERAVKRSYLRWACSRWHSKVLSRRHRRAVLRRLFGRSAAGLLTWAWSKLKLKPSAATRGRKPRRLGLCRCVYALCHGGHCTCSWELHFAKRLKNFGSLAESADTLLYSQRSAGRAFEVSYDEGLGVEATEPPKTLRSSGDGFMRSRDMSTVVPEYDLNGRRVRVGRRGRRPRPGKVEDAGRRLEKPTT